MRVRSLRWLWVSALALSACYRSGSRTDGGVDDDASPDVTGCEGGSTIGEACARDADCDDGCFCDGVEVCRAGVCAAAPVDPCEDAIACTADSCREGPGCAHAPRDEMCNDGNACTDQ